MIVSGEQALTNGDNDQREVLCSYRVFWRLAGHSVARLAPVHAVVCLLYVAQLESTGN